jgi:hypothetical protein
MDDEARELSGVYQKLTPVRLVPDQIDVACEGVEVHGNVDRTRPNDLVRDVCAVGRLRVSRLVSHSVTVDLARRASSSCVDRNTLVGRA